MDERRAVHVRLIGIDTPEVAHSGGPGECFGAAAARMTRSLALDRRVTLEPGRERHDRYGRLLAYVRVAGGPDDLELTLLARGAARTLASVPTPTAPPPMQRRSVRRAARDAGCGARARHAERAPEHADRGAACDGRAARARPGLSAQGLPTPQLQRRRLPAVDPAAFRLRLYHR